MREYYKYCCIEGDIGTRATIHYGISDSDDKKNITHESEDFIDFLFSDEKIPPSTDADLPF